MGNELDRSSKTNVIYEWLERILFERLGIRFSIQPINYATLLLRTENRIGGIKMIANPRFFKTSVNLPHTEWDASKEGWHAPLSKPLPAPGVGDLPSPLIESTIDGYIIHYDILGLTYWMLSRREEVERMDLDEHCRFPATSSHAYKHGYLERPVVDEWFQILRQVIRRLWPELVLIEPVFSMRVSHDVDRPSRYGFRSPVQMMRAIAGDIILRHDSSSLVKAFLVRMNTKRKLHKLDPYNTFDWIMDVSEQHGLKSAFYFICGRTDPAKDSDYDLGHPAIRSLMRHIHQRGHEIGLHPSYRTYRNAQAIAMEAEYLKRICAEEGINQSQWGGRMHYLRWENPTTLRGWEEAGMSYDSTLTYADLPGFRCGTCHEYPSFDPVKNEMLNLRIRPLIAMECTVMNEMYMGLGTSEEAYLKFMHLKKTCQAVGGTFTLLWHNSELHSDEKRALYKTIVSSDTSGSP